MAQLSVLDEQIESLRSKLYEALSNKKLLGKDEVLKCSQDLDKLILKYYDSLREQECDIKFP